jgi:outer membrane protein assembly factor BamE (lipoprotein component of BamABCDE complex)
MSNQPIYSGLHMGRTRPEETSATRITLSNSYNPLKGIIMTGILKGTITSTVTSTMKGFALATTIILTGCASQGGDGGVAQSVGDGIKGAAEGVGNVVGGIFQPYVNGVKVTEAQMAQLEPGMTSDQVEQIIGMPPEITEIGGNEVWSYPFSQINHFAANISETTVVRFEDGKLAKAYKTNSRSSSTGNPLVDAANGTQ